MRNSQLPILVSVLAVLVLVVGVVWWRGREPVKSPGQLARAALRQGDTKKQREAAMGLAAAAESSPGIAADNRVQPYLVQVLRESDNPGVRAACMRGLAAIWDRSCADLMLQALDDPSDDGEVFSAGGHALERLMGQRYYLDDSNRRRAYWADFHFEGPREGRPATAARLRRAWEEHLARLELEKKQRLQH